MDNNNPNTDEVKREKVRVIPVKFIDDFPDHPFQVKDDEGMEQLIRSIDMNGVLNPVIARKKEDGRYELISGHRRKHACVVLGIETIPNGMKDEVKKQMIYLASVDVLRRLLQQGIDEKIIERLNQKNAETMGCKAVPII